MVRGGANGCDVGDSDGDATKMIKTTVTRSMSRSMKFKPSNKRGRTTKKKEPVVQKLYDIVVDGVVCQCSSTPEEYLEYRKALDELISNPPCRKDPNYAKQQGDWLCRQYFTRIQEGRKEMADYVLVEPMFVKVILEVGCWAHMNFKAKPKDADDSGADMYFAELCVFDKKITCLSKLDIDFSADSSAYKRCLYCHPDPANVMFSVGVSGCVYHPIDAKLSFR